MAKQRDAVRARRIGWFGLAALLGLASGAAQGADILEVYRLAQASDPTFQGARYTLQAAEAKIPQARAGLLPTVTINGSDNQTRASTSYPGILNDPVARDVNAWTWTLQLTQPLIRVQNLYAYRESERVVEQARAQYAQAEQDLIQRVAQAYFDVLVAEEAVAAADAQERAMAQQLDQARHGFDAGTDAITDVNEAQSKFDLARAQRVAASNDLETKRAELGQITGRPPRFLAALKPAVVIPRPEPPDVKAWVGRARDNNPAVRADQAALAAAWAEEARNRAEYLPTVDLVASYGKNYASGSLTTPQDFGTEQRSRVAGVRVTIPLYSGGATGARVDEATANEYKARTELEAARRQAATDARKAYAGIVNGRSQIDALDAALTSSLSAVKGNRIGYRLGIRINLDVLNAEEQLFATRRDLAKARYDMLMQGLKLKAAAGVLTEADVATVNGLLAGARGGPSELSDGGGNVDTGLAGHDSAHE